MVPHECFLSSLCRSDLNNLPVIVGKLPETKHEAYSSVQAVHAYMQTEKREHFYFKKEKFQSCGTVSFPTPA